MVLKIKLGVGGKTTATIIAPSPTAKDATTRSTQPSTVDFDRSAPAPSTSAATRREQHVRVADFRLQTLKHVSSVAVEQIYRSLQEATITMANPGVQDDARKHKLLRFVCESRQRLLRILVLTSWCKADRPKVAVLERCMALLRACEGYTTSLRVAADGMAFLHDDVRDMRQPRYDIDTAIQILGRGKPPVMPQSMEDVVASSEPTRIPANPEAEQDALRRLSTVTRIKLLELRRKGAPGRGIETAVAEGRAVFKAPGLFEVAVAIDPASLSLEDSQKEASWHVHSVAVRVADKSEGGTPIAALSAAQTDALAFQIERVFAGPLSEILGPLLACLTELSSKLALYLASSQLHDATKAPVGKLRGIVRVEGASAEGEGLRCHYWIDHMQDKATGSDKAGPYVEISTAGGSFRCENVVPQAKAWAHGGTPLPVDTTAIDMEATLASAAQQTGAAILDAIGSGLATHPPWIASEGACTRECDANGQCRALTVAVSGMPVVTLEVSCPQPPFPLFPILLPPPSLSLVISLACSYM